MSNILLFLTLKKTSNVKILNFFLRNKVLIRTAFLKKKVTNTQFLLNLKFLVKKKKFFF